jgi:hypothetical protein
LAGLSKLGVVCVVVGIGLTVSAAAHAAHHSTEGTAAGGRSPAQTLQSCMNNPDVQQVTVDANDDVSAVNIYTTLAGDIGSSLGQDLNDQIIGNQIVTQFVGCNAGQYGANGLVTVYSKNGTTLAAIGY